MLTPENTNEFSIHQVTFGCSLNELQWCRTVSLYGNLRSLTTLVSLCNNRRLCFPELWRRCQPSGETNLRRADQNWQLQAPVPLLWSYGRNLVPVGHHQTGTRGGWVIRRERIKYETKTDTDPQSPGRETERENKTQWNRDRSSRTPCYKTQDDSSVIILCILENIKDSKQGAWLINSV